MKRHHPQQDLEQPLMSANLKVHLCITTHWATHACFDVHCVNHAINQQLSKVEKSICGKLPAWAINKIDNR